MNSAVDELPTKKPYVAPVLTMHGDLRTLTQSGSGKASETGANRCKNTQTTKKC